MPLPDQKDYAVSRATLLTEGFKGLLVVNGGGAAALLAFISQIADKSPKMAQLSFVGVAFMAAGLGLALLVPFFRYHQSHVAQKLEAAGKTKDLKSVYWYLYTGCQYLSVVLFVAALGYLVINAYPVVAEIQVRKC
ncbi:MAG: hypothetical protein RL722_2496 [Pseudomonadota bacterium]|jgi:mannose/fructose/N-acetylgalactosamine-specific phosphotransferase system component IIC